MGVVTRGFRGRGRRDDKLPPGQYLTEDFPVLSAGPTPRVDLDRWEFAITTETGQRHAWTWPSCWRCRRETVTVDLHCVTKWSKLGTTWRGVSLDALLADVETAADYALAHSYGGYTHEPAAGGPPGRSGLGRVRVRRRAARAGARRSGPAARAAPVPVEEREVGAGYPAAAGRTIRASGRALGYHNYGDPWREQRYWGD